jgi:hypothetical protein
MTTDFGSLLRANTPVSRMMTTYTRRGPGQTYLKRVLADKINSLIEHKDLNLEINPLKVRSFFLYFSSRQLLIPLRRYTNKCFTKSNQTADQYPMTCHAALHRTKQPPTPTSKR